MKAPNVVTLTGIRFNYYKGVSLAYKEIKVKVVPTVGLYPGHLLEGRRSNTYAISSSPYKEHLKQVGKNHYWSYITGGSLVQYVFLELASATGYYYA